MRCRFLSAVSTAILIPLTGCYLDQLQAEKRANTLLQQDTARTQPKPEYQMSVASSPKAAAAGERTAPAESEGEPDSSAELAAGVDESKKQPDRILIYTASVQMSVADIEAALIAAQKITSDVGGYMQSLTGEGITIRVPAGSFFKVLDQLRPLGTTLSKRIEAQDVTDEYVDLQLRLRNAEALRDRLQEILDRAQTVKDTLEVEKELNRVREEIERIKGRLASLEKQVRFSTITLSFIKATAPDVRPHRPETPFPWLDRLGVETVLNIGSQHP